MEVWSNCNISGFDAPNLRAVNAIRDAVDDSPSVRECHECGAADAVAETAMSLIGTKLPNRDVRDPVATGG
jgi:hypothetical protein